MKKTIFIIITLLAFLITIDTVKAACAQVNSTCNHYYFDKTGDKFNLEIGKNEKGERYAIIEAGGNTKELTGTSVYMSGYFKYNNITSFSINASFIDEMPDTMSFNKTCPDQDCMVSFVSGSSGLNATKAVSDSSIPDPENPGGTGSKCYFEDAVSCKRYNGLLDAHKNSFAVEIGNSSLGNYFIVSYNSFSTLYGTENMNIGTSDNNYSVYQTTKDSFKLGSIDVFNNYPSQVIVNSNNLGEGIYQYTIIADRSNGSAGAGNNSEDNDYYYSDMDCYGLLGNPNDANAPAYWIQFALKIMRYAAIIALFGLSTADFIKAFTSQNQDAMKTAFSTAGKRLIYAVLIFFLPVVVEFIMNLFGVYGTCAL